jgi:hypothetical protein
LERDLEGGDTFVTDGEPRAPRPAHTVDILETLEPRDQVVVASAALGEGDRGEHRTGRGRGVDLRDLCARGSRREEHPVDVGPEGFGAAHPVDDPAAGVEIDLLVVPLGLPGELALDLGELLFGTA